MTQFTFNQMVQTSEMPSDSFYKKIRGFFIEEKDGWVKIEATHVIDKWSGQWENHPSSCMVQVKKEHVEVI